MEHDQPKKMACQNNTSKSSFLLAWCGSNFKTCESTRGGGSKRSGGNRSITTWCSGKGKKVGFFCKACGDKMQEKGLFEDVGDLIGSIELHKCGGPSKKKRHIR